MFERFTERARQVIVHAQDEARRLGHNYIGTEHILLGLLAESEGIAARVLESLGVTHDEADALVASIVGKGDEARATGQIPFTPRAQKTLELSLREALRMGHNYIGTEHVLLGLVAVDDGVAARVLADMGVETEAIRYQIVRLLAGLPPQGGPISSRARERSPEKVAVHPFGDLIEEVRTAKETAIEVSLFHIAAKLRDIERELLGEDPD